MIESPVGVSPAWGGGITEFFSDMRNFKPCQSHFNTAHWCSIAWRWRQNIEIPRSCYRLLILTGVAVICLYRQIVLRVLLSSFALYSLHLFDRTGNVCYLSSAIVF